MTSQKFRRATLLAVLTLSTAATATFAQQRAPWPSERFNPPAQRNVAGEFDYYALVMSWSPTYCSDASERDDQQCNRADGRRFAFILHGLWPQYEKGYPGMCRTARRPFVSQPVIDGMLDIMPSRGLIIHEYRKHGTCSGLQPENYFATARQLFSGIRVPERFKNPFETQFMSPREVISDFTRLNPQIKPDMMAIACGGSGNRLKEIRFCFTKDGTPRSCGSNEDQRRMCSADRIFVPPVRSTARDDDTTSRQPAPPASRSAPPNQSPPSGTFKNPLPGPRMDDRYRRYEEQRGI